MKTESLNKRWKEIVYGASGFGPNLFMVLMMAYFTDAMYPEFLKAAKDQWSITGYSLVFPAIWGVLWTLGRVFDGVIDLPLAHLTDNLNTRWGKRRPTILVALVPMILSFALAWFPLEYVENSLVNTIWIIGMSLIFFASNTMVLLAFHGSLTAACRDDAQRMRVSSYKSFFDTIGYCLVYALVPVFLNMGYNIRTVTMCGLPLMLTILIPLFLLKEGGKTAPSVKAEKPSFFKSFSSVICNRMFMKWVIPHAVAMFGLQMFLAGQNSLISGWMNLGPSWAAIMNACAFAPVPIMLFILYRINKRFGTRISYQTSMVMFIIGISAFFFGGEQFWPESEMPRVAFGIIGGVASSFSIGAFFSMPYVTASGIAAVEIETTGRDQTAMYFAVQTLIISIASAISTGVVYENLKLIPSEIKFLGISDIGLGLVPVIVGLSCLAAFLLCFNMPRRFDRDTLAGSFSKTK